MRCCYRNLKVRESLDATLLQYKVLVQVEPIGLVIVCIPTTTKYLMGGPTSKEVLALEDALNCKRSMPSTY